MMHSGGDEYNRESMVRCGGEAESVTSKISGVKPVYVVDEIDYVFIMQASARCIKSILKRTSTNHPNFRNAMTLIA